MLGIPAGYILKCLDIVCNADEVGLAENRTGSISIIYSSLNVQLNELLNRNIILNAVFPSCF